MNEKRESEQASELIAQGPAELLAAVLDLDGEVPLDDGAPLPPLWHWVYLLPTPPQRVLGPDGHPTKGFPTPPGLGMRRMFAGGRVTTHAPLRVGAPANRVTTASEPVHKEGRSGPLAFVTVRMEIRQEDQLVITDERDLVYRAPGKDQPKDSGKGGSPSGATAESADRDPRLDAEPRLTLEVDETVLFRFSSATVNAHRIHYDREWARHEGYDDLVVHGPLQALMMGELMRRNGVDLVGATFGYRLVAPMLGPQQLTVAAGEDGLETGAVAGGKAGRVTAVATRTNSTTNNH